MIHYKKKTKKLSNNVCETLLYIDKDGNRVTKPKRKFKHLDDAIAECKRVNAKPQTIHKVVSYKCKVCHYYHIGRNGKILKK
jgi:hypothetical protein